MGLNGIQSDHLPFNHIESNSRLLSWDLGERTEEGQARGDHVHRGSLAPALGDGSLKRDAVALRFRWVKQRWHVISNAVVEWILQRFRCFRLKPYINDTKKIIRLKCILNLDVRCGFPVDDLVTPFSECQNHGLVLSQNSWSLNPRVDHLFHYFMRPIQHEPSPSHHHE